MKYDKVVLLLDKGNNFYLLEIDDIKYHYVIGIHTLLAEQDQQSQFLLLPYLKLELNKINPKETIDKFFQLLMLAN
jgi:hypothetical protein